jgi:hypothetical protein
MVMTWFVQATRPSLPARPGHDCVRDWPTDPLTPQCISASRANRKSRNTATRLEFRSSSG